MKYTSHILAALLLTTACSEIPPEAYYNRGEPESLLDMSSEAVNISVADAQGLDELVGWVNQEQPSRAELYCDGSPSCTRAKKALDQFSVPYQFTQDPRNSVALHYERVLARDCENRYIDNSINPYNLNHPTFGCSVAANTVQAVSDKRQFINPSLLDYHDGEKAAQVYRAYQESNKAQETTDVGSLIGSGTSISR